MSAAHTTTAELKQQVFARARMVTKKRTKKHSLKSTTIAAYTGVFLLVMSVVAIGYQPPQRMDNVANAAETPVISASAPTATQPSVDQIVATNIAAGIAERAELPIAANLANLSGSLVVEGQLAQKQGSGVVSKPQIIQPTANSREIKTYTSKAGETVTQIAGQFGLTPDTIKFANNLNADVVEVGRQLTIPPVDGLIYTVKAGDTIDTIASKYRADKQRIVAYNDLELGGLSEGKKIIIPAGSLPVEERPGYVAPRNAVRSGAYSGGFSTVNAQIARASTGNSYAYGYCTWYAYERRAQLGLPIGGNWQNASSWASFARGAGFLVNNTPAAGAVIQNGGGAGHVAIVESVGSDGSLTISEMNYAGNWNRVTSRTMNAGTAAGFTYIH